MDEPSSEETMRTTIKELRRSLENAEREKDSLMKKLEGRNELQSSFLRRCRELEIYYQRELASVEELLQPLRKTIDPVETEVRAIRKRLRKAEKLVTTLIFKVESEEEAILKDRLKSCRVVYSPTSTRNGCELLSSSSIVDSSSGFSDGTQSNGTSFSSSTSCPLSSIPSVARTVRRTIPEPPGNITDADLMYFVWPTPKQDHKIGNGAHPLPKNKIFSLAELRNEVLWLRQEREDLQRILRGTYASKEFYKNVLKKLGHLNQITDKDPHTFDPSFSHALRHTDCISDCCLPTLGLNKPNYKSGRLQNIQEKFSEDLQKLHHYQSGNITRRGAVPATTTHFQDRGQFDEFSPAFRMCRDSVRGESFHTAASGNVSSSLRKNYLQSVGSSPVLRTNAVSLEELLEDVDSDEELLKVYVGSIQSPDYVRSTRPK